MRKLLLLGAIFLGLSGTAGAQGLAAGTALDSHVRVLAHHHHYWWMAVDLCTIEPVLHRDGSWGAKPLIQCTPVAAGYRNKPEPPVAGIPINSPQRIKWDQSYNPCAPAPGFPHPCSS